MMHPVTSSMFSHIGWADDTLFVRYHPTKAQREAGELGTLWAYKNYVHGVPEQQPEEGWGKWFNASVRGKYEGERVVEIPEMLLTDGVTVRETTHYGETPMDEDW